MKKSFLSKLSTVFVDQDSLSLSFTASSGNPAVTTVISHDSLFVCPRRNSGIADIFVTARNLYGETTTDSTRVIVQHVNHAPALVVPIPPKSALKNSSWTVLSLNLARSFADPDSDQLSYGALSSTPQVRTLVVHDSLLAMPAYNFYGSATLIVSATDPWNAAAHDTLVFTVANVNHPPRSFLLLSPGHGDTLSTLSAPVRFQWRRSVDADSDSVAYALYISGGGADTAVSGIVDTSAIFNGSRFWRPMTSYAWAVEATDPFGAAVVSGPFTLTIPLLAAVAPPAHRMPASFVLDQNYPNPFNPVTTIRFALPEPSHTVVTVFNALGQNVARLMDGDIAAGCHKVMFDGSGLASGLYFYRMTSTPLNHKGIFVQTRRLLLVR